MREEREMLNMSEDFAKLIEKANEIQSKCNDHPISAKDIHMSDDLKLNFADQKLPMSDLAVGHLCGKLQAPSRYFNRLVDAGQNELAAENINCWLEDNPKNLFLREYDGRIRGVLSGSYSVYDALEILQSISEVFNPSEFKLKGSFINEERLHLRLIENKMMDIDGEDLFAGITLDSSDVGRSGLSVRFFIWKQICTNGLVIAKSSAKLFKQKHIGITHEDFAAGLTEGLQTFYELKDQIAESIRETAKIPVNEDIEELIEEIKDKTNLSDESATEVIEYMNVKYDKNRWGLINGITEVAQKFTLERRIELETIAGNTLEAI